MLGFSRAKRSLGVSPTPKPPLWSPRNVLLILGLLGNTRETLIFLEGKHYLLTRGSLGSLEGAPRDGSRLDFLRLPPCSPG